MILSRLLTFILTCVLSCAGLAQHQVYLATWDSLYLADVSTCSVQLIGATGRLLYDIALNPVDNRLYGIDGSGDLCTINKNTGATNVIGQAGVMTSLTFTKDGTLYGVYGNRLCTIDLLTGARTVVSIMLDAASGDLALWNGKLYYPGHRSQLHLIEIDLNNQYSVKSIGYFPSWVPFLYGLGSLGCDSKLYGFHEGHVYTITPSDLYANPSTNPVFVGIHCWNIIPDYILGAASLAEDINLEELNLGDDLTLCEGETITLNQSIPNANYLWQDNSINNAYTVTSAGTYTLTVSIDTCTATDSIIVDYIHKPALDLGNDTIICEGNLLELDATTANASYLWQDGSVNSTYLVNQGGAYVSSVTVDNCTSIDTINVTYLSPPLLSWDREATICEGTTIVLNAENPTASYLWQDYSTNSSLNVNRTGDYSVTVTNYCGQVEQEIRVETKECNCFKGIPDVFTPNEDGINDTFQPLKKCDLELVAFEIFNRWGQVVYKMDDAMEAVWDGTFRGSDCPTEVYVYLLQYYNDDGDVETRKGTVTLIR